MTDSTGTQAEKEAEHYLLQQGMRLQQRNFRCKVGEIDLIMTDGSTYVFIEVRYRRSTRFGSPAETVNWSKRQKLQRAAQYFLQHHRLLDRVPCRFDVVSISKQLDSSPTIEWIQNAF